MEVLQGASQSESRGRTLLHKHKVRLQSQSVMAKACKTRGRDADRHLTRNYPVCFLITLELLHYITRNCILFVCKGITFVYINFYGVKRCWKYFVCVMHLSSLCSFHIISKSKGFHATVEKKTFITFMKVRKQGKDMCWCSFNLKQFISPLT